MVEKTLGNNSEIPVATRLINEIDNMREGFLKNIDTNLESETTISIQCNEVVSTQLKMWARLKRWVFPLLKFAFLHPFAHQWHFLAPNLSLINFNINQTNLWKQDAGKAGGQWHEIKMKTRFRGVAGRRSVMIMASPSSLAICINWHIMSIYHIHIHMLDLKIHLSLSLLQFNITIISYPRVIYQSSHLHYRQTKASGAIGGVWHINGGAAAVSDCRGCQQLVQVTQQSQAAARGNSGWLSSTVANATAMAWGYWTAHSLAPR